MAHKTVLGIHWLGGYKERQRGEGRGRQGKGRREERRERRGQGRREGRRDPAASESQ